MRLAALHADISDAPHLATGSVAPEETGELPIALEAVVEAVNDHADRGPAA